MIPYYKAIEIDDLKEMVRTSITMAELMRKLGYTANRGNSFHGLKKYLDGLHIDYSHFKGKAHGTSITIKYDLKDILKENSTYSNMTKLKKRVLQNQLLEYKCAICGINEWQGKTLVLQLDHINGNNRDNRLENLRLLCPNCHSQTPTFCRKRQLNLEN